MLTEGRSLMLQHGPLVVTSSMHSSSLAHGKKLSEFACASALLSLRSVTASMQMVMSTTRGFHFFPAWFLTKLIPLHTLSSSVLPFETCNLLDHEKFSLRSLDLTFMFLLKYWCSLGNFSFSALTIMLSLSCACTGIWVIWFSDSVCHTQVWCMQVDLSSTKVWMSSWDQRWLKITCAVLLLKV